MRSIYQNRFSSAEYRRTAWHAIPEEGTAFEDVLDPNYWTHVAAQLKVGDHIEVMPEDMSYWADLLVVSTGRVSATVACLNRVAIHVNTVEEVVDPQYDIKFKGPMRKWSIIRLADGEYVQEGFQSRDEATRALAGYLKALAA